MSRHTTGFLGNVQTSENHIIETLFTTKIKLHFDEHSLQNILFILLLLQFLASHVSTETLIRSM